jgi:AcrR family transcriptional regulator
MAVQTPPSRRERRIAARRSAILEAAARLFAERGFHRTTTRDIAEAADVSEGTLYNYFENKDELLMGIMAQLEETQQVATRMAGSFPSDAREFLEFLLHYRKEIMDKNGSMLQSVLSEILVNPELRQRYYQELLVPSISIMQSDLCARIERGQIRKVDASMVARFLIGLTTGLFVLQVLGDPQISFYWDDLSETITSIIFDGLDNQA